MYLVQDYNHIGFLRQCQNYTLSFQQTVHALVLQNLNTEKKRGEWASLDNKFVDVFNTPLASNRHIGLSPIYTHRWERGNSQHSHLPDKYSPMYKSGGKIGQGNPKNYLSRISEECAQRLLKLIEENIDANVLPLIESIFDDVEEINILEDYEEVDNQNIPITEKIALRNSRRGQGLFRARVIEIEKCCRVTGLSNEKLLIASHIKSWKSSNNFERLDGSNGLLLSPHIDKLFDKYYISFNKDGSLLVKNKSAKEALKLWGITGVKILRPLSTKQELYMNLHRERLKV